jgi:hypothetical protein
MLRTSVCPVVYRILFPVVLTSRLQGIGRPFFGRAYQLPLTWEASNGEKVGLLRSLRLRSG